MKIMALFFVILMFGSTFAYALMNMFGNESEEISIPQEKILNYELNDAQRKYLLTRGYTLIEYYFPDGCLDCISTKNNLEQLTQRSEGQIYLQEVTKGETTGIVLTSRNGQKILTEPTGEEIETTVCSLLLQKPLWCVTSKI